MVDSWVENVNFSKEFQAFCHPGTAIQPTFWVAVQNVSISVEIQKCCISIGISTFFNYFNKLPEQAALGSLCGIREADGICCLVFPTT